MPEQPSGLERVLPLIALAIAGLKGGAPGGALLESFAGARQQQGELDLQQAAGARAERGIALQEQQAQQAGQRQAIQQALELKKLRLDVMLKALSAEDPETAQLMLDTANQEFSSGGAGLQMTLPPEALDAKNRARLQKLAKDELDRQLKVFGSEQKLYEMAQTGATQTVSSAILRALPKDLRVGANSVKVRDLMVIAGWPLSPEGELVAPGQSGQEKFRTDFAQRLGKKTVAELTGPEEAAAEQEWKRQTRLLPQPPAFMQVPTTTPEGLPATGIIPGSAVPPQGMVIPREPSLDTVPADFRNALDRATMGMPARRRTQITQLANRLAVQGDDEQLKGVIRQAAIENENVATQAQVEGRIQFINSLDDVKALLDELRVSGVDTNLLRGTAEDVMRRLGTSTDPRLATLATRIGETLFEYRRSLTGVQFSFREAEQYKGMFPNYQNTFPLNVAVIEGLLRGARLRDQEFWERKLGPDGAVLVGALPPAPEMPSDAEPRTSPLDRLRGLRGR